MKISHKILQWSIFFNVHLVQFIFQLDCTFTKNQITNDCLCINTGRKNTKRIASILVFTIKIMIEQFNKGFTLLIAQINYSHTDERILACISKLFLSKLPYVYTLFLTSLYSPIRGISTLPWDGFLFVRLLGNFLILI